MSTLSLKMALPVVIAGLFIIVSFVALNYGNLNASFYIIFLLLVAYVFLFAFATGQNVTIPIRQLLKRANDLITGDLSSRVYSDSSDELGQLADAFNSIAGRLEKTSVEQEKAKKTIRNKVETETKLFREVIIALEQKVQNRAVEFQKMAMDLEKFKRSSEAKEKELVELKSQLVQLTKKPSRRSAKKVNSL